MAKPDTRTAEGRIVADRRILIVFFTLLIVSSIISIVGLWLSDSLSFGGLMASATGSFSGSFVLAGILVMFYYGRLGFVPGKRLVKWFLLASLVAAFVIIAALAVTYVGDLVYMGEIPHGPLGLVSAGVGFYIAGFAMVFVLLIVGLLLAAGGIGVMSALARMFTPPILANIARSERKTLKDKAIAWLFCIPDALDTRSLTVASEVKVDGVAWNGVKRAVTWQIILGLVLCVYVSFNTLISGSEASVMYQMFLLLINASVFIPLIVLPWFIFLSLDAKLKGTIRDFTLYDGIKSRVFRSYVAVSTLLIFIRLTLSKVELGTYLLGFGAYLGSLAAISLGFTFVYFNFFARDLGRDISAVYASSEPRTERVDEPVQ